MEKEEGEYIVSQEPVILERYDHLIKFKMTPKRMKIKK